MKKLFLIFGLTWLVCSGVVILLIDVIADLAPYWPAASTLDGVGIVMMVCLFAPGVAALLIGWRMERGREDG